MSLNASKVLFTIVQLIVLGLLLTLLFKNYLAFRDISKGETLTKDAIEKLATWNLVFFSLYIIVIGIVILVSLSGIAFVMTTISSDAFNQKDKKLLSTLETNNLAEDLSAK
jgi:ABC-type Fe3+-siderophore transport system permease subunit